MRTFYARDAINKRIYSFDPPIMESFVLKSLICYLLHSDYLLRNLLPLRIRFDHNAYLVS